MIRRTWINKMAITLFSNVSCARVFQTGAAVFIKFASHNFRRSITLFKLFTRCTVDSQTTTVPAEMKMLKLNKMSESDSDEMAWCETLFETLRRASGEKRKMNCQFFFYVFFFCQKMKQQQRRSTKNTKIFFGNGCGFTAIVNIATAVECPGIAVVPCPAMIDYIRSWNGRSIDRSYQTEIDFRRKKPIGCLARDYVTRLVLL